MLVNEVLATLADDTINRVDQLRRVLLADFFDHLSANILETIGIRADLSALRIHHLLLHACTLFPCPDDDLLDQSQALVRVLASALANVLETLLAPLSRDRLFELQGKFTLYGDFGWAGQTPATPD